MRRCPGGRRKEEVLHRKEEKWLFVSLPSFLGGEFWIGGERHIARDIETRGGAVGWV